MNRGSLDSRTSPPPTSVDWGEFELWVSRDNLTASADEDGGAGEVAGRKARRVWVGIGVAFGVLVALVAVQHTLNPPPPGPDAPAAAPAAPVAPDLPAADAKPAAGSVPAATRDAAVPVATPHTTLVGAADALDSDGWTLIGLQRTASMGTAPAAVIGYDPSSGRLVTTPLPALGTGGPVALVAASAATFVKPMGNVPGYVAADGPAVTMPGLLARVSWAWPGSDDGYLWAIRGVGITQRLVLLTVDGKADGPEIELTATRAPDHDYSIRPDGAGYILATGTGGTYQLSRGEPRLVTHGRVLAAGPTGWLTLDCDRAAVCRTTFVDRAARSEEALPISGFDPGRYQVQGIVSPDGHYAALLDTSHRHETVTLVDLAAGEAATVPVGFGGRYFNDTSSATAFTRDGKYLLIAGTVGIVPVDLATRAVLPPLPVPPLDAFALRTAPAR